MKKESVCGFSLSVVVFAFVLAPTGCDRCSRQATGITTPESTLGNAAPIVVMTDGGAVSSQALITEALANKVAGPTPSGGKISGATTPMAVECKSLGQPVSPTIFGIAWADTDKDIGATAHRWGGNTTTRYNPKLGAWNTGSDWFWQNLKIDSHEVFLAKAAAKGGLAAITVPIMGWVAKDTTSASFPISAFGPQQKIDPDHPAFGNGTKADGKTLIPPGDPTRTSVKVTPEDVAEFVTKVLAYEKKLGKKSFSSGFSTMSQGSGTRRTGTFIPSHSPTTSYSKKRSRSVLRFAKQTQVLSSPAPRPTDGGSTFTARKTRSQGSEANPIVRRTATYRCSPGTCENSQSTKKNRRAYSRRPRRSRLSASR